MYPQNNNNIIKKCQIVSKKSIKTIQRGKNSLQQMSGKLDINTQSNEIGSYLYIKLTQNGSNM
jgi:hypothetical protein